MAKAKLRSVVANRLGTLALGINEQIDRAIAHATGLGASDNAALVLLGASPGITMGGLERALGLSQSATVRLIDRLQEAGHVVRRPGRDKRELALYLSALGLDCRNRILDARLQVLEDLIGDLGKGERRMLLALLDRLLPELRAEPGGADHACRLCDIEMCRLRDCPLQPLAFDMEDVP
jgi:DNA-binding MarR family transcriptional regulator